LSATEDKRLLLLHQEEVSELDDPRLHGRFNLLEFNLDEGRVVFGFATNSLRLNIR
jgi:hypothetical protein